MRPDLRPLTPDPHAPEPLTYSELVSQNAYLTHITGAERRRHAAVEKQFVKALNELQETLSDVRQLYIAQLSSRLLPLPSERQAK